MSSISSSPFDLDLQATPHQPETRQAVASETLLERLCSVRQQTMALCEPLTPEDMMVQSSAEASPAKWHLAHTSWFFETFILREFVPGYQQFHPDFLWLFNSYYNSVSDQPQKKLRASFSRPSIDAIFAYRAHVDAALQTLFADDAPEDAPEEAKRRLVLGLHHEQQHQELLITDVKNAFWSNPLRPAYRENATLGSESAAGSRQASMTKQITPQQWQHFEGGLQEIGHQYEGFCFDNEEPRHRVYLEPFALATRPVSCAEYLQFMQDGGYSRSELWLAQGWDTVQAEQWQAPLYWHRAHEEEDAEWMIFTLHGDVPLSALLASPVCHVSYYEADAFARWAGMRLPTEAEWEVAAAESGSLEAQQGQFLEGGMLHPVASPQIEDAGRAPSVGQLLGSVWEWTASAYLGYPGYAAVPGALGEYNGKFMSNQMVLRGGSVTTPASHIRETYRNFFPPVTRWQFSGIRLARR